MLEVGRVHKAKGRGELQVLRGRREDGGENRRLGKRWGVKGNGCNSSRAILLNAIERDNHLIEDTWNIIIEKLR